MKSQKGTRNILISRFSALGDVAMTLPSVYEVCASNPDDNFFMLTRRHPASLFINTPPNLTVTGIDLDNYKGIKGLWKLASSLRKRYSITHYADLHDVLRTKILRIFMLAYGVKVKHIHKGRQAKKRLTRRHNKHLLQLKPTITRYNEVFDRLCINRSESFRSIYDNTTPDDGLYSAVTTPKKPGEKWLAVAPFAKHKGKIYPEKHLKKVIAHYAARNDIKIFMLGAGEKESEFIDNLKGDLPNVINMAAANLGLQAEMALISRCDAMLSMDSANMHIASLTGTPVISIWGATHPFSGFLGRGQSSENTVQLDMVCRPCSVFGNKPCLRKDYHCLHGITPSLVISKLDHYLKHPRN